jgi:putative MATE family efflux protein
VDDHRLNAQAPAHLRWPAWRLVLMLAWPALLQQSLILAVNLSDRFLAGHFKLLSDEEHTATQAAQTTAAYLAWFLSSYTVLVSVGCTTLVAHFVGAGDRRGAQLATNQSILLAVVVGLLGTALGLVALRPVLGLLQLQGAAAIHAADYLRPMFYLLVFQAVSAAGIGALTGAGDTRSGMWVLGGVALINLPMAWAFFHGVGPLPGLGFAGIGAGTALSQALGGAVVIVLLLCGRAGLRLRWTMLAPRFDILHRLLRVSVPATADNLSVAVGYLWFLSIVNGLGDVAAAAHGIALTWEALGYQLGAAFGTAAIAVVGQHLGAGQPHEATRGGWVAFGMGAGVMTTMGVIFFLLAGPMFRLFCPHPGQAEIVKMGAPLLRLVAFTMPALASCIVLAWALRGAGDTRVPVLYTWLGFFAIRIPLAYLLTRDRLDLGPLGSAPGAGLGLYGAWLAMGADVLVRGALLMGRFASGRWTSVRV